MSVAAPVESFEEEQVEAPEPIDSRRLGIQIEAKLAEWHLSYKYVRRLPLRDLRVADWIQVRESEHIADKDSLSEFIVQMKEGAIYPPIVVMHPNTLVDGNHRFNAAKHLRFNDLPAYIVEFPTVDMAKAFAAAMNQVNGRRLTNEEAFQSAETMFAMGLDDQAIAREVGRTQDAVRDMRRRKDFEIRAKQLGIDERAEPITNTQRAKLARISHNPVFAKAVEVVGEAKLGAKTVNQIVKAAESASSDADAIDAIEQIRTELAVAGPPPTRVTVPPAVKQTRLHLGGLLKFEQNPLEVLDLVDETHRHDAIDKWTRLSAMAHTVLEAYGT